MQTDIRLIESQIEAMAEKPIKTLEEIEIELVLDNLDLEREQI